MKKHFSTLFGILFLVGCSSYASPLPRASSRSTPLHFGRYVTPDPATNPIDPPERFTGYHAATDFEIRKGEENEDVEVYAICGGPIIFSGFSEGYGGLITQFCNLKEQDVTVIYGHLAVDSLVPSGTLVETGALLGILGAARSTDTDGSRKHLHLGIAKGHGSEVHGYVQNESELDLFLDPQEVLD
jgi:hypothetical protein